LKSEARGLAAQAPPTPAGTTINLVIGGTAINRPCPLGIGDRNADEEQRERRDKNPRGAILKLDVSNQA